MKMKTRPKTFKVTPAVLKYLKQVWGYRKVGDVDPLTAECIVENCEDPDAVDAKTGRVKWTSDFALKQAICKLHDIPQSVTYKGFRKYFFIKWRGRGANRFNEAFWKVSKKDQKLMDDCVAMGLLH